MHCTWYGVSDLRYSSETATVVISFRKNATKSVVLRVVKTTVNIEMSCS